MPRYNYHDQLKAIRENPAEYNLPDDINKPVEDYLSGIGCEIGVKRLQEMRKCIQFGTIELVNKDVPNAKLQINVSSGMVDERKEYKLEEDGNWVMVSYHTVRNRNLDKKKRDDHGHRKNNCSN